MIEFSPAAYDSVIDHALAGTPEEVCGVLGGDRGDELSQVRTIERASNASETPGYTYTIDPEEQLALIERLESDGKDIVGFYHSHPAGPPGPSETDAERATWPGLSYVIVVLAGDHPYVGSWRWDGQAERFEQEIVRVASTA